MEDRKRILPLLPLRDIVVFPHMVVPLFIGRDRSIAALDASLAQDRLIFLAAQKDAATNEPGEGDIFRIGTVAHIVQILKLPDSLPNDRYFQGSVEECPIERFGGPLTQALIRNVVSSFENFAKLSKKIPSEVLMQLSSLDDPSKLADTVAAHLPIKLSDKQAALELPTARDQLEKVLALLEGEIEILEIEKKIRGRVKKLRLMSPMAAEAPVSRNYVDWLISIPWQERTEDKLDIEAAERILNEDHYGLEKVKERILEYLPVRKLVAKLKGPNLCFVGPPGVGKTSLAKSIARGTGRKFVRMSLGGVRADAEIRGHRRTYIGALPGKIIQNLSKGKVGN